jgi:DNA-binding NtrC family response regulator
MRTEVLIVDDEPTVLRFVQVALENQGYSVSGSLTPYDALQLYQTAQPRRFDILVTDFFVPQAGMAELLKHLEAQNSHLQVFCITELGEQETVALDRGRCTVVLHKPFTAETLYGAVESRTVPVAA